MKQAILVVDDDPVQRRLLQAALEKMGHIVATADSGEKALSILDNPSDIRPDAMVLDLFMPGMDGLAVMEAMTAKRHDLPVIVQTAQGGVDIAVSAMRAGAFDFCVKPVSPDRLGRTIRDALKVRSTESGVSGKDRQRNKRRTSSFVGQGDAVKRVLGLVSKAAISDIPVLIEGESGTGKELIAKSVHAESDRSDKPLIIVNCGAIPENLVESILFGHERGAFTGATEKHTGKFVEADGGTLFLDEIGDLPLDAQVKVLRAIQSGEVEPVGARHSRKVDVRLISATHRDLIAAVRNGVFREDLYYRLNVFPILVPPLRYRTEDIEALIAHFMRHYAQGGQFSASTISQDALDLLVAHDWPGNVRQLENAVFRAMVLCEGSRLQPEHFPQISAQVNGISIPEAPPSAPDYADARPDDDNEINAGADTSAEPAEPWLALYDGSGHMRKLDDVESEMIERAIERYDGRMTEVARRLGIGRSTLYRKLKEHDLETSEGS